MTTRTTTGMSEAERLNALADLQRLERDARAIRDTNEGEPGDWPSEVREMFSGVLEAWYVIKCELELDEGPFAHVGREYLDAWSAPAE